MSETYKYSNLLIGDDFITDIATLISGQNLIKGTALGLITASGKVTELVSGASDGSQTPFAILAEDCNATAGDTSCPVYLFGEFNSGAMTFNGSDTAAQFKAGFRDVGIYLKTTVPA